VRLKRREFINISAIGYACTLAGAALSDTVPGSQQAASGGRYRITVLQRTPDKATGRLCSLFHENQMIVVESIDKKPDAFCSEGWADILSCIREAGDRAAGTSVCGCTGPSPVFFNIERMYG
jgi:hypothetical protein